MKRTRTLAWPAASSERKKKRRTTTTSSDEDEGSIGMMPPLMLSSIGGAKKSSTNTHANHIYFNDDITTESVADLIQQLREVELQQRQLAVVYEIDPAPPIYLHLTTNGGEVHAAFAVVDAIEKSKVPVYTVVEGFVASAGTLISLAGAKRFVSKNAYMLIHELRSGIWGKMSAIEEEVANLKKIMAHITTYYEDKTTISRKALEKLLVKDVIWNAEECIKKGVADELS